MLTYWALNFDEGFSLVNTIPQALLKIICLQVMNTVLSIFQRTFIFVNLFLYLIALKF